MHLAVASPPQISPQPARKHEPHRSFRGELSCKERSATKPDSSWASGRGAPEPWRRKEQSDDRSHREGASSAASARKNFQCFTACNSGRTVLQGATSDAAGQFVGKRAGSAGAVAQEG